MRNILNFSPGDYIIRQGERDDTLYILNRGRLVVERDRVKLAEITEPSTVFGEMSSILGTARTSSVIAVTDVEVIQVPDGVDNILRNRPPGWDVLIKGLMFNLAKGLDTTSEVATWVKWKYQPRETEKQDALRD